MKKIMFFFLFNSLILNAKAQISQGLSLEANAFVGRIIRHSKRIIMPPTKSAFGLDIHANWQLSGQKDWHQWQGFPSVGVSLMSIDLGEPQAVGTAYGICPTIDFKILKTRPLSITSRIGAGIGYLTRHYDQFDNPNFNAIGTHVNCLLQLKLRAEVRLSPKIKAYVGGSFTHFSNGGARLPNFGLNIPALDVGVRWTLDTEGVVVRHNISARSPKKWGVNTVAGMALSANSPRGPRYPIYSASIALVRHFSKISRTSFGVGYEQNRLIAEFGLHAPFYASRREARLAAERWTGFVEQEVLFGSVAMVFHSGIYFRDFEGVRNLWYNKIGLRVYMPPIGRPKTQFHVGFYLKAHLAAAEYIAFTGGASF